MNADVWTTVFEYLDEKMIFVVTCVCKYWYSVLTTPHDYLWNSRVFAFGSETEALVQRLGPREYVRLYHYFEERIDRLVHFKGWPDRH